MSAIGYGIVHLCVCLRVQGLYRGAAHCTLDQSPSADASDNDNDNDTMTMTHSEKSHIHRMKAWPYRQECRGHDPTKKNLFCWCSLLVGKVCRYKLLEDRLYRNDT